MGISDVVGDSAAILEEYLDIGRTYGKHTLVAAEVDVILQVVASVYDTCLNCGGKGTADKKRSQQGAAEGNIEVELYIRSGGGEECYTRARSYIAAILAFLSGSVEDRIAPERKNNAKREKIRTG